MNKIILVISLILIILIGSIASYFYLSSETHIKAQIENANYCEIKEDCVNLGSNCPFGCYVYVNKDEVKTIKNLIDRYGKNPFHGVCDYSCLAIKDVTCTNGRCEIIYN